MTRFAPLLVVIVALALSACGSRKDLRPAEGASLPPVPYGATSQPGPNSLLDIPVEARPGRSNELLTESKERESSAFDLPPG